MNVSAVRNTAKRYHKEKHPDKNFDDLAQSTREQYRNKAIHEWERRTGRKAYSQVSGNMTFKEYFNQMSDQQKRDWLGKGKYDLWKTGRYEVADFIPPYPDKAMSVKQLKAADKGSFDFMKNSPGSKKGLCNAKNISDAVQFTLQNVATHVDQSGFDTKTLNEFNDMIYTKMQKYNIEKFENITVNTDCILGVSRDNKTFVYNPSAWENFVKDPRGTFRRYVTKYKKREGRPFFAIDKKENVTSHAIDHEIGHVLFNRSFLANKETKLTELWKKHNNGIEFSIDANSNSREFFAETFAIYERGGRLSKDIQDFIIEVLK